MAVNRGEEHPRRTVAPGTDHRIAIQHAVLYGYEDHTFRPGNNATRDHASKLICNALTNTFR